MMTGILRKVIAGFCYVEAGQFIYECKPRGNIKRIMGNILAGDSVEFTPSEDHKGTIEKINPRKNRLIRPPLANVNTLFVVSSYCTPSPNTLLIDRLTAIAESKDIEIVIVFNKSDLGSFEELTNTYKLAGFNVFVVSTMQPESLNELREYLFSKEGISAFTGNSGVGKSSILNILLPELSLKTGVVSDKLGRGKHTTREVELFKLPNGGYIADTPGFSSLDIERCEIVLKDELPYCFKEFNDFVTDCRFTTCTHTGEPGCGVINAVNKGLIPPSRYENYVTLYNEIKDIKEWNLNKNKK